MTQGGGFFYLYIVILEGYYIDGNRPHNYRVIAILRFIMTSPVPIHTDYRIRNVSFHCTLYLKTSRFNFYRVIETVCSSIQGHMNYLNLKRYMHTIIAYYD